MSKDPQDYNGDRSSGEFIIYQLLVDYKHHVDSPNWITLSMWITNYNLEDPEFSAPTLLQHQMTFSDCSSRTRLWTHY